MARYIDADKLIERLNASCVFPNMGQDGYFLRDCVIDIISKQPTADAVETTKDVEMLCKIKTNIIKNVSTMIEIDFSEIVKDALGERKVE